MTQLYLASTSPARKQILHDIGLSATVVVPDVDEEQATEDMVDNSEAAAVALHLAKLKAHSVLSPAIDGLVIGGDSVFEFEAPTMANPMNPKWRSPAGG